MYIQQDDKEGTIKLTQKGLCKRIIDALQLHGHPVKAMHATREHLVADQNGMPAQAKYSFSSVIGMLQYLQGHSRSDITHAVSQCTQFTHNPKRSHEVALE